MSISSLCSIHAITHERESIAKGGGMGSIRTWVTQGASAGAKTCRIQPRNSQNEDVFEKDDEASTHVIYFSENPIAEVTDRFTFVDALSNTRYFHVTGQIDFDELARVIRVTAEERTGRL